ncbi:MAG TPA: hypothetical protein VJC37_07525 [Planctomycetota bacterium]|nr:hypothetical protein [Planctomycetota bacterium]
MKKWLMGSMLIASLVVGCSTAPKMPGEITLSPGANQVKAPWAGFNDSAWVQSQRVNLVDNTTSEVRQSIHQIARGEAVIVTAVKMGDKWEKVGMEPVSLFPIPKSTKESVKSTIMIGDKELSCKVVEISIKMGEKPSVMKMWMCDEIPGGIAKQEKDGKVFWQAVDFGLDGKTPTLAEVTEPKNAWAKFGKGSWVQYKILNPEDQKEIQQRYTVVDVTKEKATIEISQLEGEKWEKKSNQEVSLQPTLVAKNQGTPATLDVAGKKVNCVCIEKTYQMNNAATLVKAWTSDDVPGFEVRKEMGGKCVMEVVDFGVVK